MRRKKYVRGNVNMLTFYYFNYLNKYLSNKRLTNGIVSLVC